MQLYKRGEKQTNKLHKIEQNILWKSPFFFFLCVRHVEEVVLVRVTNALWKAEEVPGVPAMRSGPRGSSMVSTRVRGAGWGIESSESNPAEEEEAPASSPTAPSSIPSKQTGDRSSPNSNERELCFIYSCLQAGAVVHKIPTSLCTSLIMDHLI